MGKAQLYPHNLSRQGFCDSQHNLNLTNFSMFSLKKISAIMGAVTMHTHACYKALWQTGDNLLSVLPFYLVALQTELRLSGLAVKASALTC